MNNSNNYIIEDNFDFYKELNTATADVDINIVTTDDNKCMISRSPLTHNSITLQCKHSFNYLPLYKELCIHNNKKNISCPYCRTVSSKLIPFIPLPTVTKIVGVNHPEKECMPGPKCSVVLKHGERKGTPCGHNGTMTDEGIFCEKHKHYIKQDVWTEAMTELMQTKSVIELKQMLKGKGLKVGGVKKDLVKRLLS